MLILVHGTNEIKKKRLIGTLCDMTATQIYFPKHEDWVSPSCEEFMVKPWIRDFVD